MSVVKAECHARGDNGSPYRRICSVEDPYAVPVRRLRWEIVDRNGLHGVPSKWTGLEALRRSLGSSRASLKGDFVKEVSDQSQVGITCVQMHLSRKVKL